MVGARMRRRRFLQSGAAGAAVVGLGALGGGAASAAAVQHGKIRLVFRAWTSNSSYQTEQQLMQQAAAPWIAQHPGVELTVHAQTGGVSDVMTEILSGTGPDVYHSWHPQAVFSDPAFAMDLTPFVQQSNADLAVFNQEQLRVFQQPRGLLALPYYLGTYAAVVNLTLFDNAGLKYPDPNWDYTEYARLARALTSKASGNKKQIWGGSIGIGWMGSPGDSIVDAFAPPFIAWGFGGGSYADPSNAARCVADSVATVAANEWAYGLYRDNALATGATAFFSFTTNQYAVAPGPSFFLPTAATTFTSMKWDFWPMPTFPRGLASGSTEDMTVMNPATKYPDLAWDLMYWLAWEPSWQRSMMRIYLLSPALTALWDEWVRVVGETAPPLKNKNLQVFAEIAKADRAFPHQVFAYEDSQTEQIFANWGKKLLANQISVAGALQQITRQINGLEATGPQLTAQAARQLSETVAALKKAEATPAPINLGPPAQLDAGSPAVKATAKVTVSKGTYTIIGQGEGPSGSSDSGTYAAMPFSLSRGTFTVRLSGIYPYQNKTIQDGCDVALMVRSSLGSSAGNVTLGYVTGHGVHLHFRSLPGQSEGDQKDGTSPGLLPRAQFKVNDYAPAKNYLPMPLWLRLVRDGGLWTAYTSLNGKTWTQAGTPVTLEAGGVWVGLWVASNTNWNGKMVVQASFDNVSFTPTTFVQVGTP
jgi:multiple sugar transport system substrate-binding protein